jgi:excisionase family DNA binding protein
MENNNLLTIREVADALRVTPQAVYQWLWEKKLTGYKIGEDWRIKQEDLENFMRCNIEKN